MASIQNIAGDDQGANWKGTFEHTDDMPAGTETGSLAATTETGETI